MKTCDNVYFSYAPIYISTNFCQKTKILRLALSNNYYFSFIPLIYIQLHKKARAHGGLEQSPPPLITDPGGLYLQGCTALTDAKIGTALVLQVDICKENVIFPKHPNVHVFQFSTVLLPLHAGLTQPLPSNFFLHFLPNSLSNNSMPHSGMMLRNAEEIRFIILYQDMIFL